MVNKLRFLVFTIIFVLIAEFPANTAIEPEFLKLTNNIWVKEKIKHLTLEEKIGQLIMIPAYPNQGEAHKNQIINLIKNHKPGGVLIMKGSAYETAAFINEIQKESDTPLLIAIDGETGLGFRMDSTVVYPTAQCLGAITNDSLLYSIGKDLGKQFKELGIHINFAPVADINTNPANPIINHRSFGENKKNVANKAWLLASGMQDEGIIAVAKHFPGHGDTKIDSHNSLPLMNHSKERIETIETFPFRYLSEKGILGIMSAHLHVQSFDSTKIPSSLSENVLKKYLREKIGFNGFLITDAMNMKGVTLPNGNAEVQALKAGNDMVEFVTDISKTIEAVKTAIINGEITQLDIENKCARVLALKNWAGLNNYAPTILNGITEKLNAPVYNVTLRNLIENSLTVLKNESTLPISELDTLKIANVSIGSSHTTAFQEMASNYTSTDDFILPKNATSEEINRLLVDLKTYDLVICGIHNIGLYPYRNYQTTSAQIEAVTKITSQNKTISVFFGNAYAIKIFEGMDQSKSLVLAYQDNKLTQELAAQLLFGAFDAKGKLPVTINATFKAGDGYSIKNSARLKYTIPEEVKINSILLNQKIDSIANLGIEKKAYPGCQVLVAKDGKVIFHKCYGFHTYKNLDSVVKENIYDWASVTKVTGPLPAIMKLVDEKKIDTSQPFSNYWPDFKDSNKKDIIFKDILAHQGRLQAWIPYWQSTLRNNGTLRAKVFKKQPTSRHTFRVSSNLYMNKKYQKFMFDEIKNSPLRNKKEYLYSGLCFYLFPSVISNVTGQNYQSYLKNEFYGPLGAHTITYNPYKLFPLGRIVPTENDDFFRKEQLQGFVHDEGAAMMGGISGNAGLFGTANDLAKLAQMYLQKGYYGGKQYISQNTIDEFTKIQFPNNKNRRGLGFDKPLIDNNKNELKDAYPAFDTSNNSYGHSGYTGTFFWNDPDNGLLYIFFSNRVYPTRDNSKLYDLNIRTAIHQSIYDCLRIGLN